MSEREEECVDIEIWPENEAPIAVLCAVQTQWLRSGGSIYGLNYSAIPPVMRYLRIPHSEHPEVFAALQVLELEVLSVINGKR